MKVIVQDLDTGTYLSADGRWVASRADAQDFFTLLRAYHFAANNTAARFQVLLHCPDDQYSAGIIDGVGTAEVNFEAAVPAQTQMPSFRSQAKSRTVLPRICQFRLSPNQLN